MEEPVAANLGFLGKLRNDVKLPVCDLDHMAILNRKVMEEGFVTRAFYRVELFPTRVLACF